MSSYLKKNGKYGLKIPKGVCVKIRDKTVALGEYADCIAKNYDLQGVLQRLGGLEASYEGPYGEADNWSSLQSELQGAKRTAIRSLLSQVFGVDTVIGLSDEKLRFIGLDEDSTN